jgi:hypothetical protein
MINIIIDDIMSEIELEISIQSSSVLKKTF